MASDNPAKYQYEENALNTYGPGHKRDVLNQIYQQYMQNPGGMNKYMQYGADQMAQFGMEGFLPYLAQSNAQIGAGNQAANQMMQLAGQGAPQIGGAATITDPQALTAAQAQYNPALAQQIMSGAPVDAALSAANRDMYRQLGENTLTQIGMGSGQGGNTGSSRRGMAEAIAGRAALDRGADVAGQMYNDAYGMGVNTASQYGLANQGAINNMGQFNVQANQQSQMANQDAINRTNMANLQASLSGMNLSGDLLSQIYQGGLASLPQSYQFESQAPGFTLGAGQTLLEQPWNNVQKLSELLRPWAIPGTTATPGLEQSGWEKAMQGISTIGNVASGIGNFGKGFGFG